MTGGKRGEDNSIRFFLRTPEAERPEESDSSLVFEVGQDLVEKIRDIGGVAAVDVVSRAR